MLLYFLFSYESFINYEKEKNYDLNNSEENSFKRKPTNFSKNNSIEETNISEKIRLSFASNDEQKHIFWNELDEMYKKILSGENPNTTECILGKNLEFTTEDVQINVILPKHDVRIEEMIKKKRTFTINSLLTNKNTLSTIFEDENQDQLQNPVQVGNSTENTQTVCDGICTKRKISPYELALQVSKIEKNKYITENSKRFIAKDQLIRETVITEQNKEMETIDRLYRMNEYSFEIQKAPIFNQKNKKSKEQQFIDLATTVTRMHIPRISNFDRVSCYMNTILQCLYNCSIFKDFIFKNSDLFSSNQIFYILKNIFLLMENESIKVVFDPKELLFTLKGFKKFNKNSQQDAHEILGIILNEIKDDFSEKKLQVELLPFLFETIGMRQCISCGFYGEIGGSSTDFFMPVYGIPTSLEFQIDSRLIETINTHNSKIKTLCPHLNFSSEVLTVYKNLPKLIICPIIRHGYLNENTIKLEFPVDVPGFLSFGNYHYKLRAVSLHHGQSACEGHYTTLIIKNEEIFFCNDDEFERLFKNYNVFKENDMAYMIFYELADV